MVTFKVETLRDVLQQSLEYEDGEVGLQRCLELACEELVAQAFEQWEIDNGFRSRKKELFVEKD